MPQNLWLWVGFNLFVIMMLALDLGVFHRKAHEVSLRESLLWSIFWITLALAFNVGIYFWQGPDLALKFLTGYVIEKSLSVDNLFVFLMVFSYFSVSSKYQHKVLFWGIVGALLMRAVFIATGVVLLERFHWLIYIFGAFLIFTGVRMAFKHDREPHPENNPLIRLARRIFPVTSDYEGGRFFVIRDGKRWATPLFIVLLVIESTDVVFALDSIPAILAVTRDPFIVYTSNVFAILGLRALYFALAGVMRLFRFLSYGLAAILVFVGVKMLLSEFIKIPVAIALGVVGGILVLSVLISVLVPRPVESEVSHE